MQHRSKSVISRNRAKAFERLDHLATLKDGWAGKGSYAISPQVLKNVRSVLSVSNDDDWHCWMIGPDVNATLGLQSRQTGGSISVGEKEFSYYVDKEGEEYHDSHVPFSADLLLNIMRKIG